VEPGVTVIEQPLAEIGRQAVALLFERLRAPAAPVRKVTLSGRAVLRGSTASARTRLHTSTKTPPPSTFTL
jgi:LacI family fructose operon transcriptional repressor